MLHNLLQGKKGIIFGALDEHSIAWQAARSIKAAGGKFVLTNTPIALRLGKLNQLADECQTTIISADARSEEHTSELQSLMRISYAVFCLKKKKKYHITI